MSDFAVTENVERVELRVGATLQGGLVEIVRGLHVDGDDDASLAEVAATLASALTAPYTAHALTIVYYGLVEPERPVALEPGRRWQSIRAEKDPAEPSRPDSIWNDE